MDTATVAVALLAGITGSHEGDPRERTVVRNNPTRYADSALARRESAVKPARQFSVQFRDYQTYAQQAVWHTASEVPGLVGETDRKQTVLTLDVLLRVAFYVGVGDVSSRSSRCGRGGMEWVGSVSLISRGACWLVAQRRSIQGETLRDKHTSVRLNFIQGGRAAPTGTTESQNGEPAYNWPRLGGSEADAGRGKRGLDGLAACCETLVRSRVKLRHHPLPSRHRHTFMWRRAC